MEEKLHSDLTQEQTTVQQSILKPMTYNQTWVFLEITSRRGTLDSVRIISSLDFDNVWTKNRPLNQDWNVQQWFVGKEYTRRRLRCRWKKWGEECLEGQQRQLGQQPLLQESSYELESYSSLVWRLPKHIMRFWVTLIQGAEPRELLAERCIGSVFTTGGIGGPAKFSCIAMG